MEISFKELNGIPDYFTHNDQEFELIADRNKRPALALYFRFNGGKEGNGDWVLFRIKWLRDKVVLKFMSSHETYNNFKHLFIP